MTEDQLRLMREAEMELIALSNGLAKVFDKLRQNQEAEAAKDNHYLDQIAELRKAYAEDETGAKFIQTLNNMQAANDKLVEGMLDTHSDLAGLTDGILMEGLTESIDENGEAIDRNLERQQRYADGMEAFAEMERVATRLTQENTEKLLEEAEATRALEQAKQEHYAATLQAMQQVYQDTGYDAFVAMWDSLSDTAKADFIELYPEVAALTTAMGETADGAGVFAEAIARAASMDFTNLMSTIREQGKPKLQEQPAQEAKDAGFAGQLSVLENALRTGGVKAMQEALYDIYETNETLYSSLMDTYTILYKLGNEDLTDAQGAEIMADAYLTVAKASAKAADELRKQIALEDELEAASENYYRTTLEKLQSAYHAEGTKGFHDVWDQLDDTAQRFILKHYAGVGDLATETIARSMDVVDEVFGHAFDEAQAMKQKLLTESLAEGASSYMLELPALEAGENGFQEQLKALRAALGDGSFMEVIAGFGEEMANALIAENDWLNVVIASMAGAEEGTLSLTEATTLLDEHIQGTQEHFLASIESLMEANGKLLETEDEQINMLTSLMTLLGQDDGVEAFAAAFSKLDAEMRKAVYDKSPAIRRFFQDWQSGAADAESAVKEMSREVNRLKLDKLAKEGKVFSGLANAMEDAAKGGKTFSKSYGAVMSQVEELNEAMGALAFVQSDGKKKTDDLADAYNVLASYTGVSADLLRTNLDPALWAIASDMDMATESAAYLTNWLYNAAGVQFDASNWQAQLAALAASSDATVAHLAQLVQTLLQAAGASLYLDGNTVKVKWGSAGSYTPPSARKSSGGGGGGSSSKDMEKAISAIEQLLDLMRQTIALQDHSRELMQLAQDYHEVRGEVQGVIAYMQREQQVIAESSATMQAYVTQLEAEIAVKQQQVASTSTAAKEYEALAKELDELQKLHQDYSKQLIRNRTDTERLTKAMKEQRDSIRQMEIDLRNLIHDAILDREERTRRMLSGTIDLEQEIIDILTRRYEMERDELIRLADLKRSSLQEELRLLDEQLAKRRELEEQEDKLKKLAQLEAQLARISMDPTRRKEELALREEIAKLRREIAWDMAEDEVDAQKDALQQQLDSVEEYLSYIEGYYEELLSNPRKLIEEMSYLLRQTDEEILAWLTANHAEYDSATDAARQNMVIGWQEMLDDMRGYTRMYWSEVEAIIAQGDEAIISFLMQHSEDYRTAGQLQAEAYVDQWRTQLENLRNAYKQVYAEINSYSYTTIPQSTYTAPSSSSGGSSSGSSSSVKASSIWAEYLQHYPQWAEKSKELQDKHLALVISNIQDPSKTIADWLMKYRGKTIKYAQGGMADFTGLAWLDGTKSKPERILSPYQTELFEDLLASLHDIRIKTPMLPGIQGAQPASEGIHIEQITVHVERLESEADYEEMAEKVGQYLYDAMTRGTARQFIR